MELNAGLQPDISSFIVVKESIESAESKQPRLSSSETEYQIVVVVVKSGGPTSF